MCESRLTLEQRAQVVGLFEQGWGFKAVARMLDLPRRPVRSLWDRWRLMGQAALVTKKTPRRYDADLKREVVERFLAGESKTRLSVEFDLSSPRIVRTWAAIYREHGPAGLDPKPAGRPRALPEEDLDEVSRLRRENEQLHAQIAYLGKVQALRAPRRD